MTREDFIKYLEDNKIPYQEDHSIPNYDGVWVMDKDAYELSRKHPRKYKSLYVSYLRVSHFDEERPYTRRDGDCKYMDWTDVMKIVNYLGGIGV